MDESISYGLLVHKIPQKAGILSIYDLIQILEFLLTFYEMSVW